MTAHQHPPTAPPSTRRRRAAAAAFGLAVLAAVPLTAAGVIGHRAATDRPAVSAAPAGGALAIANPHAGHVAPLSADQKAAIEAQALAPVRGSEFRANCVSSHRRGDDPIVKPGQPGGSHVHEFFGNRTTNANSTLQSLSLGTSSCDPAVDLSAYWVPTLYKNGVAVPPESVIVYYQGITDPRNAKPYPRGLKVVVGNAGATSPDQNPSARWSCRGHPQSSRDFLDCPPGSKLETYLDFPTCWDGRSLDSADHRSHLAFSPGIGHPCPSTHPVPVPRVEFLITYPVNGTGLTLGGTRNGVNVTTAPGYTFHGDFFNAWPAAELQRRVTNCINAGYICGTDGNPIQQ
jgi:hypothetical protein